MKPDALRRELESELTAAQADPDRVRDAELALGTEGDPRERLAAAMRSLLWHRRPDSTICPSDAARATGGDGWRDLMDTAREVAAELARSGTIVVRQQGVDVDIATAAGPIRLARGPAW
ncbi:DUF3253 domain-containing protein [Actinoplanes sp. TRM 88003]|uniref:DUF3253 domain-containing protein n=1 Tax=Paractinoplanes aksuensis TaxID=2939490 RepID=A0ABT1DUG8_9ACTN|nr:DUF3253 domain-containing protein [Actinoplanes aksuensis]MCO8274183.1 DUF3253 domain-containing protein [Actinoplanes aksuensis]